MDHKAAFTTHYTWTIYFFHLHKRIKSFIHSFSPYSLNTIHMPHPALGTGNTTETHPYPRGAYKPVGEVHKLRGESLSHVEKAVTGMEVQETRRRGPSYLEHRDRFLRSEV